LDAEKEEGEGEGEEREEGEGEMAAADEHLVTGDVASELNLENDFAEYVNSLEMMECWERNEAELNLRKKQRRKLFAVVAAVVAVVDAVLGPALTAEGLHTPLLNLMKEIHCLPHYHQHHSSVEPN
jgi:hypothetical protein